MMQLNASNITSADTVIIEDILLSSHAVPIGETILLSPSTSCDATEDRRDAESTVRDNLLVIDEDPMDDAELVAAVESIETRKEAAIGINPHACNWASACLASGGDSNKNICNNGGGDDNNNPAQPSPKKSKQHFLEVDIGYERYLFITSDGTYLRLALRTAANVEVFRRKLHLTLGQWKNFAEHFGEMVEELEKMKNGAEVNYHLHIGSKMQVSISRGVLALDIRKWWLPNGKLTLAPGFPGISLKCREVENLSEKMEEINRFLHLENVQSCVSRHKDEAEQKKCDVCNPFQDIFF